ncbi:cell surface glycoprotein CD200 receptor 1-A-like isoform X1 [Gallus gallus]|uniref:cell surface glycoprotein CD200 receptor 1-A-like isoform X1 n=1 Tax=Gallus gallus TaxID=9031 RepID=UPI001AE76262|nr:cell surface glycoprotein CD200 receptor 1-A-like isoform X1 [Gallus gallus]XP_040520637.1 cell surface glycoprotein CD200 receptor 1-A-like isoform X1 [Gallus gallus]
MHVSFLLQSFFHLLQCRFLLLKMTQTRTVLAAVLFLMIHLPGGSAYGRVNVEAGHDAVLNCPSISKLSLLMVTWKMKSSTSCFLAYRRDLNETRMLNCSERMMWKYSPDCDPALRIYFVNLNDEGNDTCEITSSEGNFLFFFSLTVIASQLRKKAHHSPVQTETENFRFTPSHLNVPVMDHSVSPEKIYQNYKLQATFMSY